MRPCRGGSSQSWVGSLAFWYGPVYLAGRFGLPASSGGAGETECAGWMPWRINAAYYFVPGAVAGGLIGLLIIRPVNAVLGWLFRGFNRLFRPDDGGLRPACRWCAAPERARARCSTPVCSC